jgi:Txe/YoeB family toxin of Txe-Axe toxin-antitoxin module
MQSKALLYPVYDEKTEINVGIGSEIIDIKDMLDSVRYIHLETSDECLIGEINKIVYYDDKYYILDRAKTKKLLCFDSTGHFERLFGRTGQGPGEYVEPTDFMVTSSYMIILDQFAHKLLFFDRDGNYIHSLPLKYKIHAITSLDNDSLFLAKAGDNRHTDIENYELLIMNVNGEVKLKGIKNPYQIKYSLSGYYSQRMNDRIIYCKPMANTIYEITDTHIKERYQLNILNSPLPRNYEKSCGGRYENFIENYKGKYNYFSGQFIETGKCLFFIITNTANQPVTIVYNKYTKKIKSGIWGMHGGENQVDMMAFIVLSIHNYMTVNGNNIIGYIDSSYIPGIEHNNPVLFSFQIKD